MKIDLHTHSSIYSIPEEMIREAINKGLDGIAFTGHNSYKDSSFVPKLQEKYKGKIHIFRGVEYSSAWGHLLIFGVSNDDVFKIKNISPFEIINYTLSVGGAVIPTHPYKKQGYKNVLADRIYELTNITAIEGYNASAIMEDNKKAIAAASKLNLPYTGGSDAHRSDSVGNAYTVFKDLITSDEILVQALKEGEYTGMLNDHKI